jgi:hypothetical protein
MSSYSRISSNFLSFQTCGCHIYTANYNLFDDLDNDNSKFLPQRTHLAYIIIFVHVLIYMYILLLWEITNTGKNIVVAFICTNMLKSDHAVAYFCSLIDRSTLNANNDNNDSLHLSRITQLVQNYFPLWPCINTICTNIKLFFFSNEGSDILHKMSYFNRKLKKNWKVKDGIKWKFQKIFTTVFYFMLVKYISFHYHRNDVDIFIFWKCLSIPT